MVLVGSGPFGEVGVDPLWGWTLGHVARYWIARESNFRQNSRITVSRIGGATEADDATAHVYYVNWDGCTVVDEATPPTSTENTPNDDDAKDTLAEYANSLVVNLETRSPVRNSPRTS